MEAEKVVVPISIAAGVLAIAAWLRPKQSTGTTYVERQQIAMPSFNAAGLPALSDYSSLADRPGVNFGQNYSYVAPRAQNPAYSLPGPGNIDPHQVSNPYYYVYWNYLNYADYLANFNAQNAANQSGGCGCGCNGGCGGGNCGGGCSQSFPDGAGINYAVPAAYTPGVA